MSGKQKSKTKMPSETSDRLSPLRRRWLEEYAVDFNACAAAIRAGISANVARAESYKWLKDPDVQADLKELLENRRQRLDVKVEKVLEELAKIAFADIKDVVDWGAMGVVMKESRGIASDTSRAIQSVSQTQHGVTVKLYDKIGALTQIGRHLGMWLDKIAPTSPDGKTEFGKGELTDAKRIELLFQVMAKHISGADPGGRESERLAGPAGPDSDRAEPHVDATPGPADDGVCKSS